MYTFIYMCIYIHILYIYILYLRFAPPTLHINWVIGGQLAGDGQRLPVAAPGRG